METSQRIRGHWQELHGRLWWVPDELSITNKELSGLSAPSTAVVGKMAPLGATEPPALHNHREGRGELCRARHSGKQYSLVLSPIVSLVSSECFQKWKSHRIAYRSGQHRTELDKMVVRSGQVWGHALVVRKQQLWKVKGCKQCQESMLPPSTSLWCLWYR